MFIVYGCLKNCILVLEEESCPGGCPYMGPNELDYENGGRKVVACIGNSKQRYPGPIPGHSY